MPIVKPMICKMSLLIDRSFKVLSLTIPRAHQRRLEVQSLAVDMKMLAYLIRIQYPAKISTTEMTHYSNTLRIEQTILLRIVSLLIPIASKAHYREFTTMMVLEMIDMT